MNWDMDDNTNENPWYIPKIYIKLKFQPPFADFETETKIEDFKLHLERMKNLLLPMEKQYNLTQIQRRVLHQLRQRTDIIILNTDKNLGIAVIKREEYILSIYLEHFSDDNLYNILDLDQATHLMAEAQRKITNLIYTNMSVLSEPERTYFCQAFEQKYRTALFYGLPKIHKPKKNGYFRTRPVVSKCGTFVEIASKWVDYHLQQLTPLFQSYLKDSFHLLHDLQKIQIPKTCQLFTADAVSMYTYIDIKHALETMNTWFVNNEQLLPPLFPTHLILELLSIIMTHNVFKFGDLHYHQLSGTAMGTAVAPIFALLYYGIHEETTLLPKFRSNIIYYRRFIDDIFVLWNPLHDDDCNHVSFEKDLAFGKLEWKMEPPTTKTVFLDLNIEINRGKIKTSTHHKPLNLHLYIPPKSAHPPKVLYGLIAGSIRRFWLQNSNPKDYRKNIVFLFDRLVARGHDRATLLPLFSRASRMFFKKMEQLKPSSMKSPTKITNNTPFIFISSTILEASQDE